jgi:carbon storage regulator CsrA
MLVLSRGRNEKVVFPTLGISVEILRVAGNKVRLGIDAPQEIPVHRHEVSERIAAGANADGQDAIIRMPARRDDVSRKLTHAVRNRLHAASLGLHILHRKLESDDLTDAEATIFQIFNELKAIESQLELPSRSESATATTDHGEPHPRALVVEDNDQERALLADYLRVNGFDVDTAADGLQAMVRLTEKSPPDVVLLDMRMPKFDGRKTITAIRNNPDYRNLKLFAVSGTRPEEMNVSLGPNGVDRWFTKPIDPGMLLEAMRNDIHREHVLA